MNDSGEAANTTQGYEMGEGGESPSQSGVDSPMLPQADQPVNLATGANGSVKSAPLSMGDQQAVDNTLLNISALKQNLSHMYTHHPNKYH